MPNDLSFTGYIDYFEGIATNLKAIGHSDSSKRFFRININEITEKLRSGINLDAQLLALEKYEVNLSYNDADQYYLYREGAFWLLEKVEVDNFDAENTAYNDTEASVIEIIKRIRRDATQANKVNRTPTLIDKNSFSWLPVRDIFEAGIIGWRVSFRMAQIQDMKYQTNKWSDG